NIQSANPHQFSNSQILKFFPDLPLKPSTSQMICVVRGGAQHPSRQKPGETPSFLWQSYAHMTTALRVLLVEGDEAEARLWLRELENGGYQVAWERVDTAEAMADALVRSPWDVVLCDSVLPRLDGSAALTLRRALRSDVPTLIIAGES